MKPESLILSTALGVFLIIAAMALFGDPGLVGIPADIETKFEQRVLQQNPPANQNAAVMPQEWNQGRVETNLGKAFQQQNPLTSPNGMVLVAQQQNPGNPLVLDKTAIEQQLVAQQDKLNLQLVKTIQVTEAHWQGMELMELTREVKQKLNYPPELTGLLIDEVTLNAILSTALAGDVLLAVDGEEVTDLKGLQLITKAIRNNRKAKLQVWRKGQIMNMELKADDFLGFAQLESAPMIVAGTPMPHPYRGECTSCHLIGLTGHMNPAPDAIVLPPPPIARGAQMPHRNYGTCESCHVIK